MSFVCDGKFITDQINEVGTNVTLRVVTSTVNDSVSKWGDADEAFVDSTIKAVITTFSRDKAEEEHSIFVDGDMLIVVSTENADLIVNGNRVIFKNQEFEINRVMQHISGEITYMVEASLEKI